MCCEFLCMFYVLFLCTYKAYAYRQKQYSHKSGTQRRVMSVFATNMLTLDIRNSH